MIDAKKVTNFIENELANNFNIRKVHSDMLTTFLVHGTLERPIKPAAPSRGASAEDYRQFADELEAYEKAHRLYKKITVVSLAYLVFIVSV
jgi:hypothetical protein